jgi:hypothetical protein
VLTFWHDFARGSLASHDFHAVTAHTVQNPELALLLPEGIEIAEFNSRETRMGESPLPALETVSKMGTKKDENWNQIKTSSVLFIIADLTSRTKIVNFALISTHCKEK